MATPEFSEDRKAEIIKFFSVMTRVDKVTARRLLEKSGWEVHVASRNLDAERSGHNTVTSSDEASNDCSGTKNNEQTQKKTGVMTISSLPRQNFGLALQWDPGNDKRGAATSSPFKGRGRVVGGEAEYERWMNAQQAAKDQSSTNKEDESVVEQPKDESRFKDFDPDQSKTTLQLRLPDNSRLEVTFNQSHTVGDIRKHIAQWRPKIMPYFQLLSTVSYPPKKLSDNAETLEAAGLLNAALIVRYKH